MSMNRRYWFQAALGSAAAAIIAPAELFADPQPKLTIYKSPSCGCCSKWVDHVKAAGFKTQIHDLENVGAIKQKYGVPAELASCHTVLVSGYVLEGHVPADVIRKLLAGKPRIVGIAVPGMPAGSPGMEMGARKDRYDIIAWTRSGKQSVFARK